MPSYVNVNGVLRESSTAVNVNGVLREPSTYVNVNGVLRESSNTKVTEERIKYFKLVYTVNKKIKHPDFPKLEYNPKIPVRLMVTGEENNQVNLNFKGVELEYDRNKIDQEGILAYDAHLYAILTNDTPIDVCCIRNLNDLKIQIQATILYEANGYFVAGWNSLFNTDQFISILPDPWADRKYKYINSYSILPEEDRDEKYSSIGQIGIARDMHNDGDNMVGSYGLIDQTIHWITVDGIKKPFIVEVYD